MEVSRSDVLGADASTREAVELALSRALSAVTRPASGPHRLATDVRSAESAGNRAGPA